jgi:OOP family OmpA-OmpF porin
MARARMRATSAKALGPCGGEQRVGSSWACRVGVASAAALAVAFAASPAGAQQQTFHLDRLEVWGAPDDGIGVFRPVTNDKPIFFAQLALGFSLDPLHTSTVTNVTSVPGSTSTASNAVIVGQFTEYASVGFEFLDRFTLAATLPITEEWGNNPPVGIGTGDTSTAIVNAGTTGDARLDLRGVALRTKDRRGAIGADFSLRLPNGGNGNFGGDGQATALLMIAAEYNFHIIRDWNLIVTANTGIDFRPDRVFNNPVVSSTGGLGVGDEWRWAVAAYLPLKADKYRLGLAFMGQTGIENNAVVGNTVFNGSNTPLEWQAEGRMRFGRYDRFWAGVGAGTRLDLAYGAPDLRIVAMAGIYVPLLDSDANSPEAKLERHRRWREQHVTDTDHDGIPDDIDACPTEPEDHLGSDPNDGCPLPPDRDGDGIPDQYDKCPDVPEDKDGVEDADGCPEDDADHDGIPDTKDACPKEPGLPSPDPKKNGCPQFIKVEGSIVHILQQVHFATASTTILPDSFPMLQEIANLLKSNQAIKRMSIEGHTDDRGAADYNMTLSDGRAASVRAWLVQHGIEPGRLESHGFGKTKPIEDNATEAGRLANRRVEFKILEEDNSFGRAKPAPSEPAPKQP